ncbi:unnamed protein product [Echinostoma caproni]|uniref:N-acetylmuramic acid 6-phosphate etherase n=1 Tax=Echinostoma caproni TaxID=27848 RepID=A0A183BAN3_9TREM|nr:unnamed protein product [Echinostoma caproni]
MSRDTHQANAEPVSTNLSDPVARLREETNAALADIVSGRAQADLSSPLSFLRETDSALWDDATASGGVGVTGSGEDEVSVLSPARRRRRGRGRGRVCVRVCVGPACFMRCRHV